MDEDDGSASTASERDRAEADAAFRRALEATAVFAVGDAVVEASRSLRAALLLPARLWRLARRSRRLASADLRTLSARPLHVGAALFADPAARLRFVDAAAPADPRGAEAVGRRALAELGDDPAAAAGLAFALHRGGAIAEPAGLLGGAAPPPSAGAEQRLRAARLRDEERLLREGASVPPRGAGRASGKGALYVAHMALPFHVTGYAVRTHEFLKALGAAGIAATCVTRPGYPWDRADARALDRAAVAEERIEGVRYRRINGASAQDAPLSDFAAVAAEALLGEIARLRPAVVAAGSNHVNALPALIAARRAGLPFVYDVRGLWEWSDAARRPGWERSERFALARRLETQVAAEADHVFAISGAVRDALVDRGVAPERIGLAPNGVDPDRFAAPRDEALRARIGLRPAEIAVGFLGSFEAYEGLDTLVEAFARASAGRDDLRLVLVGGGPEARPILERAAALGLAGRMIAPGRVPFAEAPRWYAACDLFVYPRRDAQLCRLVPPLKPLEAMAAERPIIVSNLGPLRELAGAPRMAVPVAPDDPDALAAAIRRLADDPAERRRLGESAGAFVRRERNWRRSFDPMIETLSALGAADTCPSWRETPT